MADQTTYLQGQDYTLSGAGVTAAAVTLTLTSMKYPDGTNIITADLGSGCQAVFEPETSREENFVFTTITQNANGTATLTGITRALAFKPPYTQDVALAEAHAGGTKVRISNTAPFYDRLTAKANDETITGVWTFPNNASTPVLGTVYAAPTTDLQVASKKYVDDIAIAGAPNMGLATKGIAEEATTAEINAGTQVGSTGAELAMNPFYFSTSVYAVPNNGTISASNRPVSQTGLQLAQEVFAASATGNDTYVVTLSPVPVAYVQGMIVRFKPDTANTGAATLNVNGLGAIAITAPDGTALVTGNIVANQIVEVVYNSTGPTFRIQSGTAGFGIPVSIYDAKGDLISASAADTPTRLPVGATTGHVLTVDPAQATGLKYAANLFVAAGTGTRTAGAGVGTQAIVGVGGTPKMIKISAIQDNAAGSSMSVGHGTAGNVACTSFFVVSGGASRAALVSGSIIYNVINTVLTAEATLNSIDADGFTLNWTTMATSTCSYSWECWY